MDYTISPITSEDRTAIIDIFNYYVEHSFAAYPQNKLPYEAFDHFMKMCEGYPAAAVRDPQQKVVGFGLLRAHNPIDTFSETAEITYFMDPAHTGKGIGGSLLSYLEAEGRKKGIRIILAHISSLNPGSILFHRKNGFVECGRFKGVGRKNGQAFDTIWMQKML
ncbi:MAG: N-acetyltransferase family protein [Nitrospirota bacterium]